MLPEEMEKGLGLTPKSEGNLWKYVQERDLEYRAAHQRISDDVKNMSARLDKHILDSEGLASTITTFLEAVERIELENSRNWLWNALLIAAFCMSSMSLWSGWLHAVNPYHSRAAELHGEVRGDVDALRSRLRALEERLASPPTAP